MSKEMNSGLGSGLYGIVLDNDDPKKIGRVKVRVKGYYDDLEEDMIPWALPLNVQFNSYNCPPKDSIVQIAFMEGNMLVPVWFAFNGHKASETELEDSEYVKGATLFYKDLSEYDGDGKAIFNFTDTDGWQMMFEKGGQRNRVQLRQDNTVWIENEKSGKVIHMSNEGEGMISLGSEDKSEEPATLGQTNHDALDKINNHIKEFSNEIEDHFQKIFMICIQNSILKPLAIPHLQAMIKLKAKISGSTYSSNKSFFPKTKSKVVSLD